MKTHDRELPDDLQPDEWPAGNNIAWSPYIWRRILEQWGGTIGLNYDPSHLVWLMIDQEPLHPRVRAAHPPLPGEGRAHRPGRPVRARHAESAASAGRSRACPVWASALGRDLRNLYRAGYAGDCIIEHEDRDFEGTDELVKRGFLLARNVLRPYCV